MASRLSTEILINLAGNLTAKARQYGANMSEFAARNQRAMSLVKATSEAAGRGIDALGNRYMGLIAGVGGSLAVRQVADFDAQMRRMGTDAQLSLEEVDALREQIRDVSNMKDIRIAAPDLGSGASELLGKTGDYQFVQDNLRNMGLLMQAFGVDGQTAAGLLAQFWEKGIKGSNDVSTMLDKLYAQFAVGSVSVADLAKVAPKLFSIIQDQGPVAISQMGAFLQVFSKNKGSAEETTTSIQAMYAALSNKDNIKFLKASGIDVFKKGTRELKLPFELMKEILKKAKNDPVKLQDIFDQTGMQGITSLLKPENLKLLEDMIYSTAEIGSTQEAAQRNAESFNASMQALNNEWQRFAESELAKPIQELADALNAVDHETVQNWLEVGKYIGIAVGGIVAARKAFKIGKGTWDFIDKYWNKKGKGGAAGGAADIFGSGVMPVYVVNMGKGGLGGLPDGGGKNGSGTSGKPGPGTGGKPGAGGGKGSFGTAAMGVAGRAGGALGLAYTATEVYDYIASEYPEAIEFDKMLMDEVQGFFSGDAREPLKQWSTDLTGVDLKANANPDFAVQEKSWDPYQTRDSSKYEIPQYGTLMETFRNVLNEVNDLNIESAGAWELFRNQQNNQALLPPVPQELKGELRVIVEGDARVKSVKMNQPGVTLSASAGVSDVGQS